MGERDDWVTPGAYAVAPGVWRIPLPLPTDGLRAVNVYCVRDGEDVVLVDSGWAIADARQQLEAALASIDAELGGVRRFLVTHIHRDHFTQAVVLRREFGGRILLGERERASLDFLADATPERVSPQLPLLAESGGQQIVARFGERERPTSADLKYWEQPDEWLADGAVTAVGGRELTAINTPGHTQGHLVYTDAAAGLLFAGDHVLPHITPSIGFESAPADFPLRDYLASLRLVRALPDMRLLPAHGPVTESAHARIDELLDHHDRRLETTLAAVRAGAATPFEAAGILTWTRRERKLAELDPFNGMLAVLETRAHLDVLALQGKLASEQVDGVVHYTLR